MEMFLKTCYEGITRKPYLHASANLQNQIYQRQRIQKKTWKFKIFLPNFTKTNFDMVVFASKLFFFCFVVGF